MVVAVVDISHRVIILSLHLLVGAGAGNFVAQKSILHVAGKLSITKAVSTRQSFQVSWHHTDLQLQFRRSKRAKAWLDMMA